MQSEQHWSFDPYFPGCDFQPAKAVFARGIYTEIVRYLQDLHIYVPLDLLKHFKSTKETMSDGLFAGLTSKVIQLGHMVGSTYQKELCWIYPSIHLSIYPAIDLSIYRSIQLSIFPSIQLSMHPTIRLSILPSVCLSFYPSVYLSVCQSIHLSIYLSICLSIYLSIDSSLCPSIHPPNPMTITMVIRKRHFRISFQLTETSLHIQKIHKQT